MTITSRAKIYLGISVFMILVSIFSLAFWGLKLGIDFTGGSTMELEFAKERLSGQEIKDKLAGLDLGRITVSTKGSRNLILRLRDIDEESHQEILSRFGAGVTEKQFESIGPVIGQELKEKSIYAIVLSLAGIMMYMVWAFRKVSRPIPSWKYGTVAIMALAHDIIITLGVFSFLGHYYNVEISLSLIAAFLTILGYSVNNTIVVFDRLRENLMTTDWSDFNQAANESVNQSLSRCLNTALTTIFALLAIYFLGGETTKHFALALMIGIIIGAYSAIFAITSLITLWHGRQEKA